MASSAIESTPKHEGAEASDWVVRHAALVPRGGSVLDLAAGGGRHARLFAALGHPVVAVDRNVARLAGEPGIVAIPADLEDGSPWPLGDRRFDGIVVTNYLWRPLLPRLVAAVAPGGTLIYETFALGNEAFGRPRNPDHLLKPGELLEVVRGALTVRAYEHGRIDRPAPAMIQRIAAVRDA